MENFRKTLIIILDIKANDIQTRAHQLRQESLIHEGNYHKSGVNVTSQYHLSASHGMEKLSPFAANLQRNFLMKNQQIKPLSQPEECDCGLSMLDQTTFFDFQLCFAQIDFLLEIFPRSHSEQLPHHCCNNFPSDIYFCWPPIHAYLQNVCKP